MERREEPGSALIAGEHTPRAIAAVRGGCEADEEEARSRITESGQRARPVRLVAVASRRIRARRLAVRDEPRAAPTTYDLRGEAGERGRGLQSGRIVTR